MSERTTWSAESDARLLALRAAGLTWDAMAEELGLKRNSVIERGRRLNARKGPAQVAMPAREQEACPDRPARPPGHPESWGLITAGTVLEGCAYPFPVFL